MKKPILLLFTIVTFIFNFGLTENLQGQTAAVTVNYPGFLACGGCVVCGGDYYCFNTLSSYCGNTASCITKTFTNPVPAGNIVTGVNISYFSAGCGGGSLSANINGQAVPAVNEGNAGCPCSSAPCVQSASSSSVFPCGLPGYNNGAGASNSLQLCTGADVCINRLVITLTYAPANQASPAIQPTSVLGQTNVCPSAIQTFSCPAVSNASSYNWTLPPGWTINSGAGTNIITATPGTAGNVCVRAQNLCGNSVYTCLAVNLLTNSTPPASASANPNPVCASASTTTLNLSGGSLGTAANWNWYSGSCGGTLVGSGSSIVVSPSSTTTYYVSASGTCNTTACSSVLFTVNPAPTANAGTPKVLNCTTTNTVLSGSGGGTYSWSGPGIVSGAASSNPTVNLPGTYSLIVTNAGCPSTVSTVVVTQNNTPPAVTAATSGVLNCTLTSVNVSATTGTSPVTYNWSGIGITAGAGTGTITVNQPGTFNYTVTNTGNGCSTTGSQLVTQNSGGPAVTASTSGSINCLATTVNVSATTVTSPVSYNWSGPGIATGAGTGTISVNQGGTYNYTVTNTSNGCVTVGSQAVTQNTTSTTPTISTTGAITCTTNTLTISSIPVSGVTYTWTGVGIVGSGNLQNININQGGVYTLSVTNIYGCVGTETVSIVTNTVVPTFTLGSASSVTTTCAVPNATLSATSSTDPNTIYTWTTPSSSTLTGSPISVSAAGIYTVVVTNTVNGCTSSVTASQSTVEVIVDSGIPVVTLASNSASITCSNPTPSVAITTTASPVSYSWVPTAGILAGTQTSATPVFTAAGTYSAVVTNTLSGCATGISGNIVTVILDNLPPVITLTSAINSGSITCIKLSVSVTPTITPSNNLTYTWSPSIGIATSVNQANATFTAAGVYTLAVTNTLTGCVSTSTSSANSFTVTDNNAAPTASINAASTNSIIGCGATNASVSISSANSTGTNPFSITWLPGNSSSPALNVTSAGTYTLVLTDNVNGCTDTTTYTVAGSTTTPQGVDAGTSANIACGDATVTLNGIATSTNVSYSWAGPSATSLTGANTANPVASEVGDYTLTVTDNSTGCQSTATVNVGQAIATASITANPTNGLSPLNVAFTGTGSGNANFSWDFGNGSTSNSQNPNSTFLTGTYNVTLTTTSGSCTATANIQIVVEDGLTLEIPNVFTPNNDGSNDIFTIKSTGVKEISLQIFNRWGEKLYEFAGPSASWDGLTPNGIKVPEGTYFFFVKATGFDDTEIEKNGTVNLFR